MQAYKIVYVKEDQKISYYHSCMGCYTGSVQYFTDRYTTASALSVCMGYHLLVFESTTAAYDFNIAKPDEHQLWMCDIRGIVSPMPPRLHVMPEVLMKNDHSLVKLGISNQHHYITNNGKWPEGTLMAAQARLLEKIT